MFDRRCSLSGQRKVEGIIRIFTKEQVLAGPSTCFIDGGLEKK